MINNLYQKNKVRVIAGPCAIESEEMLNKIACCIKDLGLEYIRGGAYKPRVSPHSFQGLGSKGVEILVKTGNKYSLKTITEVLDEASLIKAKSCVDALQIGTRNMTNYSFLKLVGKATCSNKKPILFKRGMASRISEWLSAAEYINEEGNNNIMLCERGIRTFEDATRFTLDISAVPIVHALSSYPVCVDVSHAAGGSKIVPDLAKAAIASGADAVMLEIHPDPKKAKCDGAQQLNLENFIKLINDLKSLTKALGKELV